MDCPRNLKHRIGSNVSSNRKVRTFEHSHGGDWSDWPQSLRVREFPATAVNDNEK